MCHEAIKDMNSALMRTDRWTMKLNGRLEALYTGSRVDVRGRCTEELIGQPGCGTVHKFCGSAVMSSLMIVQVPSNHGQ